MKKLYVIIGIFLFISLASALTYEKETLTDLKIPCVINGHPCTTDATCILTIKHPNSTYIIRNNSMTNQGNGDFNYTLTFPTIGIYPSKVFCNQTGQNATVNFPITITNEGGELTLGQSILYVAGLLIMIFFFMLFLYGGIKIPFKNSRDYSGKVVNVNDLKYLKVFLLFLSYVSLMFIFGITHSITRNFLTIPGLENFFNYLFWILFSFMWPLMILSLVLTVVFYLQDLKFKESILRGAPMN